MAKAYKPPVVVSLKGHSKKEKRQVVKVLTGDVVKDRHYRKTLKCAETPIPKKVAKAAARAAVEATLDRAEEAPTPLDRYTAFVDKFASARRKYKKKQAKKQKSARKAGYDPAIGLYALKKLKKVKMAKKAKPYKAKKKKK